MFILRFNLKNTTHIIQHVKNYKTGKKGLYQNHLQKFYQNNNHHL